jgi:ribosomal protein S12 methylthiotransferase
VKELLVVSQDTSAYGVDVKYRTGFWDGKPVKTRMLELCTRWPIWPSRTAPGCGCTTSTPTRSVDEMLPLMARAGAALPGRALPARHPDVLKRMKRPASGERNLERLQAGARPAPRSCPLAPSSPAFPGETEAEFQHLLDFCARRRSTAPAALPIRRSTAPRPTTCRACCRRNVREERRARFMAVAEEVSIAKLQRRVGATMQVLVDHAPALGRKGGTGRSYADAPEIDGTVRLLPPEKASKTLKVGEFTRARIVATEGHDLVGQPI